MNLSVPGYNKLYKLQDKAWKFCIIEGTLRRPEIVTEGDNGELLEKKKNIQWNYDAEADVLYRFHFKLRK